MSFDTSWDAESYRTAFESDEHWQLKRDFIAAHKENLPEDRLICLAQVFANVELMGCKYPDKVMEQVGVLAEDIATNYQASRENKLKRTFASAQKAAEAKVQAQASRKPPTEWGEKQRKKVFTGPVAFVKASADDKADEDGQSSSPKLKAGVTFCPEGDGSNEPLWMKQQRDDLYKNQEDQKKSMKGFGPIHDIESQIKKARLSDSPHQSENPQQNDSKGWDKQQGQQREQQQQRPEPPQPPQHWRQQQPLNRQQQQQKEQGNRQQATGSMSINISQKSERRQISAPDYGDDRGQPPHKNKNQQFNRQQQQQQQLMGGIGDGRGAPPHRNQQFNRQQPDLKLPGQRSNDPLSSFVIVTRKYNLGAFYPLSIINDSVSFNGTTAQYNYSFKGASTICKLLIGGTVIASGEGECKKTAKDDSATQALQSLRARCHTLQVLKKHIGEESVTTNLVDGGGGTNEPLPENNFGSKLLKMMGWSGGGLGKHGTGIAEPIKAEAVLGRQGLGHKAAGGVTNQFKQTIKKIIQDYISADQQGDLIFSSDFSKEQRAEIHTIARRMNFKSASTGTGDNRFLAISRKDKCGKRNVLQEVLEMGGETEKYRLLKPGQHWSDESDS